MTTIYTAQREIHQLIARVEAAHRYNHAEGHHLLRLALGRMLKSSGDSMLRLSEKAIKNAYAVKLEKPIEGAIILTHSADVTLEAKVSQPRQTFDKDGFISAIATEYDLSRRDLHQIAARCMKDTKPPVSLIVSLNENKD